MADIGKTTMDHQLDAVRASPDRYARSAAYCGCILVWVTQSRNLLLPGKRSATG